MASAPGTSMERTRAPTRTRNIPQGLRREAFVALIGAFRQRFRGTQLGASQQRGRAPWTAAIGPEHGRARRSGAGGHGFRGASRERPPASDRWFFRAAVKRDLVPPSSAIDLGGRERTQSKPGWTSVRASAPSVAASVSNVTMTRVPCCPSGRPKICSVSRISAR